MESRAPHAVAGDGSPTRDALLDAAEELFAAHGYAAVGMRELVARAGVNLSAVKYHFGSKRELYLETVRRAMQRRESMEVWAALEPRPSTVDAAAKALVLFVRGLFVMMRARSELSACARLMLHEAMDPSDALEDVVVSFTRPNVEALAGVIAVLRPGADRQELELDARSVLGQALHYLLLRPIVERSAGLSLSESGTSREIADHIATFSLRGLRVSEAVVGRALAADGPKKNPIAAGEGAPASHEAPMGDPDRMEGSR